MHTQILRIAALATLLATTVGDVLADSAKKNYRLYCMGCHQIDGSGSPVNGIPNMRDVVGHFLRLSEGRAYLAQVPGTLNTPLGDGETAELLNWLVVNIGRGSVPPDFVPYSPADLARYRASVPENIPETRVQLLQRLERMGLKSMALL